MALKSRFSFYIPIMQNDYISIYSITTYSQEDATKTKQLSGDPPKSDFQKTEYTEQQKQLVVWEYCEQFIDMVMKNQCVLLVGKTGSGKSTQVSF